MDNEKAIRVLEEFKVIDDWTAVHLPPMEDAVDMAIKAIQAKTDGVFVKGGLTISGEPPMPEGCMDCKLQGRCLCIPPDLSADEISELYISRRPNCPLSMVAEPKTGEWVMKEHLWECDQCGCRINRANPLKGNIWNYYFCPNCGADMRGEEE